MIAKTGLLVVSNPNQINKLLSAVQKHVKNTLYVQLLTSLGEPFGQFHVKTLNTWPKYSRTIYNIYAQAASNCNQLDVKVLLSGLKHNVPKIKTQNPIDLIIFDKEHRQEDIESFIKARIENITNAYNVITLDTGDSEFVPETTNCSDPVHSHVVLGGTFDRLHTAHKLLLSEAALRSKEKVTIGVTTENMLYTKLLWELIEDIDKRLNNVKDFVTDVCPELMYDIVQISDPFGPSIVDASMEAIIVSNETLRGGEKVNELRKEKKLSILEIVPIELVDEPNPKPNEERKISSSTTRIRILGTLLRPVLSNDNLPKPPYIIGLTGGIASGKSGVAKHLLDLGAFVINCDLIGHNVYKAGKPCHTALVTHFGDRILQSDGEIDRKVLGGIVFKHPEEMKVLNSIVWPGIAEEVKHIIKNSESRVIVIEAAVLFMAGWDENCHEVWTTMIPKDEAVRRLIERNNLTEEQAISRIEAQPTNSFYVKKAHVAFSTLWEVEYTKEQVLKAWDLLQRRI